MCFIIPLPHNDIMKQTKNLYKAFFKEILTDKWMIVNAQRPKQWYDVCKPVTVFTLSGLSVNY